MGARRLHSENKVRFQDVGVGIAIAIDPVSLDSDADTDPDPVKKPTYFGAHPCPKKGANFLEFRGYVRSSEVGAYWAGTSDFHDAVLDRDRKSLQEPIPPSMVIRELALAKGEQPYIDMAI